MSRHPGPTERTPLLSQSDNRPSTSDGGNRVPADESLQDIPSPPIKVWVFICIALWVPVFVSSLDSTIVATLVGSISSSFNQSEQSAWLGTSYLLSVCCFTPIYGRLCDAMGRKYTMLLALSFFTLGTLLCGLSSSMEMLLFSRALAGVGGGGLATCTTTIMSDIIPLRSRGLYQGLTNIIYGLGAVLGGPFGGLLNDTWGWRNAFLVQTPLLLISIVLCFVFVHGQPPSLQDKPSASTFNKIKTIDALGSITLVGCVAPILLGLSFVSSNDRSFSEPIVWAGLLAGFLSGIAFILVEIYFATAPILPIHLITQRTGASVGLANFFLSITAFTFIYNYPLMFQATRLLSSSQAGLHLIPNSVRLGVGSISAGLWMRQTGYYYSFNLVSSFLLIISLTSCALLSPSTPDWVTYAIAVPNGFGNSTVLTCTLLALINSVPRAEIAVATGMSYLFRTTGQVVGVSLSGALLQAVLKKQLRKRINDEDLISNIRNQSSIIVDLPNHLRQEAIESYVIALRSVFLFGLAAAIATCFCCFLIENRKLPEMSRVTQDNSPRQEEEHRR